MRIERAPSYIPALPLASPPLSSPPLSSPPRREPQKLPVKHAAETAYGFLRGLFHKPRLDLSGTEGVSPPQRGNKLDLVIDGAEFEETLVKEIETARQSVWMCFYLFDLKVGGAIEEALMNALARGVTVRIVADDRNTVDEFLEPTLSPVLQRLQDAGAHIVHAKTEGVAVNHRKLTVFDGRRATVTGQNLTDNYTKAGVYHDAGVLIEGPSVRDVAEAFAESWLEGGGDALPLPPRSAPRNEDETTVRVVRHQGQQDRNIERELVNRINAATTHIRLANPFAMTQALQDALIAAVDRGVRVQWLWGRELTNEDQVMSLSTIKRLLNGGVEIYQYPTPLHAKLYVFDDTHTIIGSSNLDGYATWLNDETVAHIEGKPFTEGAIRRFFLPSFDKSARVTEPPRITMGSRLKDWALRLLARAIGR